MGSRHRRGRQESVSVVVPDRTYDLLNINEKMTMTEMLNLLMVPGFPLDGRCLNLEQSKSKPVEVKPVPGTYLADSKTTFPVSEHLTPQEFLMQAGFSAFQAYSVCENRRIKAKLTAAITEARVWLNRMTKNQALLIYGLSVKMMTKDMPPLFLQLTEAIANQRITNMMQLFDYLRLMKLIGRLPLQSEFSETVKEAFPKDEFKKKKKPSPKKFGRRYRRRSRLDSASTFFEAEKIDNEQIKPVETVSSDDVSKKKKKETKLKIKEKKTKHKTDGKKRQDEDSS